MNRRCFPLVAASLMALSSQAQQIDFNIASRKAAEVTALNFTPVGVKQAIHTSLLWVDWRLHSILP